MAKSRLQHAVDHFRAQLQAQEAAALSTLDAAHQRILKQIAPHLEALYDAMVEKLAGGEKIPASWLYEAGRLGAITKLISHEIGQFASLALMQVSALQHLAVDLGTKAAQAFLHATLPENVRWSFGMPSLKAISELVGVTQDGSPLADLFNGFGREAAQKAEEALLSGVAMGKNPRDIAPAVQDALGISRNRALVISRQESLRCYKNAATETYRENPETIQQWRWTCSLSRRTCPACLAMDGTLHNLEENLESHVMCFPAGTIVSGPRVAGSTQRWYSGSLVEVETANGHFLSATPNHPILTPDGWISAGDLVEGGYVFSCIDSERPLSGIDPNKNQVPALIEKVAKSFPGFGRMTTVSMPTTAEDFHGDGMDGDVSIVRTYRKLRDSRHVHVFQPLCKLSLCRGDMRLFLLPRYRLMAEFLKGWRSASNGIVGGFRSRLPLFNRHFSGHNKIRFAGAALLNTSLTQPNLDSATRYPVGFRKSQYGFPFNVALGNFIDRQSTLSQECSRGFFFAESAALFQRSEHSALAQSGHKAGFADMEAATSVFRALSGNICQDRILKINSRAFSGHVYNLQTEMGWYTANNIITHNCRCQPVPVTRDWRDILSDAGIDTSSLDLPDTRPTLPTGADWLDNQPVDVQKQVLGPRYKGWKSGDFSLKDVVQHTHDPNWGRAIKVKPLKDLVKK